MRVCIRVLLAPIAAAVLASSAAADSFNFSTGDPDGKIATASRPGSAGVLEIESADDFVLTKNTLLTSGSFTGLIPTNGSLGDITQVRVEIYRVFPNDSDTGRTSGAPTFSTPNVPTRVNSPSDVELLDRDTAASNLTVSPTVLNARFMAANSILNGIFPKPNQTTGGDQAVTGQEVRFDLTFTTPILLPADHYFFVPQVQLSSGDFFWLSAPRPIAAPGTPFPPGFTDLQSWIRNEDLAPDWLRIGTDIVGPPATGGAAPTFNATFSLVGQTVPEPSGLLMLVMGSVVVAGAAGARGRLLLPPR
jgi:hypothetical protein